jgi:hypothetical protein
MVLSHDFLTLGGLGSTYKMHKKFTEDQRAELTRNLRNISLHIDGLDGTSQDNYCLCGISLHQWKREAQKSLILYADSIIDKEINLFGCLLEREWRDSFTQLDLGAQDIRRAIDIHTEEIKDRHIDWDLWAPANS